MALDVNDRSETLAKVPLGAPRTTRSKDRKGEILAEAARLFAVRGYAAVGMDDIGQAVGITGPALYRHFRGKQAIVTAILDQMVGSLLAAATPADAERAEGDADPAVRLRQMVTRTMELAVDATSAFTVYSRAARHHDPSNDAMFRATRRDIARRWHDALTAAQPDLSGHDVRVREEAIVSVIETLAVRSHRWSSRGRLELLTVACAMSVASTVGAAGGLGTGPAPDASGAGGADVVAASPSGWSPPVSRAEVILRSAIKLVRERGFAGVSIDEIGAAAGLTGPSLYRYYDSKLAILVDAFDQAEARVAVAAEEALASAGSAAAAMSALVRSMAEIGLGSADLVVVTARETHTLPDEARARQRRRARAHTDRWIAVLRLLRPDLSDADAESLVRAAVGLVIHLVQLRQAVQLDDVCRLAEAVLLTELPDR